MTPEILQPSYELKIFKDERWKRSIPRISFEEPYGWLSDISNIPKSYFEELLQEYVDVLEGRSENTNYFGGERALCTGYKEKTLCVDTHEETSIFVDSLWMFNLLKDYFEFKKTNFDSASKDSIN